jgi:hypothetical protein
LLDALTDWSVCVVCTRSFFSSDGKRKPNKWDNIDFDEEEKRVESEEKLADAALNDQKGLNKELTALQKSAFGLEHDFEEVCNKYIDALQGDDEVRGRRKALSTCVQRHLEAVDKLKKQVARCAKAPEPPKAKRPDDAAKVLVQPPKAAPAPAAANRNPYTVLRSNPAASSRAAAPAPAPPPAAAAVRPPPAPPAAPAAAAPGIAGAAAAAVAAGAAAAPSTGSVWNTAGTWEEKDVTDWAKKTLADGWGPLTLRVGGQEAEAEAGAAAPTEGAAAASAAAAATVYHGAATVITCGRISGPVTGTAVLNSVRGKKGVIYDLSFSVPWTAELESHTYNGTLQVTDFSSAAEFDLDLQWGRRPPGATAGALRKLILAKGGEGLGPMLAGEFERFASACKGLC